MRAFRTTARMAVLALGAACTSLDPAADRDALRTDLQQRLGHDVPTSDDAIDGAVRELLRQPLTETAAVHIALLHNHRVRATYERLAIARADLVQAGLLRNPVFDGDARFLFDGGTEIELGLAQPLLDLFFRPLRERLAEHEFAAARLLVTDALVHLVFDVRRAFVDLRTTARVVTLQQAALQAAESAHQLAVELHAAGNVTDQALAIERTGETRARLDLAAAELAELEAREVLQSLLGLWGDDTAWTLAAATADEQPVAVDTEHVEARAVTASLELAAARAGIDAAAQVAGIVSWTGWFPDARAGLSAIREPGGEWGLGPHVSLELPLFDGGGSRRTRAAANVRLGLHEQTQLAVEVRSAARRLRTRVLHLDARERFLREVHLPQRVAVLRTTLQTYNAMQIGVFDVLLQRQKQVQDEVEHALVEGDLQRARLDLRQLFAGALPAKDDDRSRTRPRPVDDTPTRGH